MVNNRIFIQNYILDYENKGGDIFFGTPCRAAFAAENENFISTKQAV